MRPGLLLVLLLVGTGAQATTFNVTSTADTVDVLPGDGVCADAAGGCTVRAAVMEANALAGADIINVPAGLYTLTRPGMGEHAAATGDLDLTGTVTIQGAGAAATLVDGGGLDRVFEARPGSTVQINAVTIRNGNAGVSDVGGGVHNFAGTLTLNDVIVTGNAAALGGGVANESGTVTVVRSTVRSNTAEGGGGIHNHGTMNVNASTVSGNQAIAGRGGGGWNDGGALTLTNSTVSGNSASVDGGGLFNSGTVLSLVHSTVSANSAPTAGGIASALNTTLRSSIVAGNTGGDCAGVFTPFFGHNLSGDSTCPLAGPGDLIGANPQLGPLANNGGTTETHALLAGSPAIDAVPVVACAASVDQRGVPRPQGGACDIGAFEATPIPTATPTAEPTASATLGCVPPPANMIAWWPLDEPAGATIIADIGPPPPHDGAAQPGPVISSPPGGPERVPGNLVTIPPDSALYFWTMGVHVDVPPSVDLNLAAADFTIDAWALVGPPPGATLNAGRDALVILPIVDRLDPVANTGYALFLQIETICQTCPPPSQPLTGPATSMTEIRIALALGDGSSLAFYRSDPIYSDSGTVFPFPTPPSPLAPLGWMHVAVSVDRQQNLGRFYYGGVHLAGSDFVPVGGVNSAVPLWIGMTRLGPPFLFTELTLNEIEIFDVALSAAEIHAIAVAPGGKCKTPGGPTPTPTPHSGCPGDCNGDGVVTINELILLVNIALGLQPLSSCPAADLNGDGTVTIAELIAAVQSALSGCPCDFIGPRMCGGFCPRPGDVCRPLPDDSGCTCQADAATPTATTTIPVGITATHTPRLTPTVTASATTTPTIPVRITATHTPRLTPTATASATASTTRTRTASATPSVTPTATPCCNLPVSLNISTGQAPIGQDDPFWRLVAAPAGTLGGTGPHPAVVIAAAPSWATLVPTQWISANAQCSLIITNDCPAGLYSYELCWSQCGSLAGTLSLALLADNSATVFLNGTPIGATTGGFTTPTLLAFADPGPGLNCFRVDVANSPASGGRGTATGIDLAGSLTGCVDIVTPCGSAGPNMCGGACPAPGDVCQTLPGAACGCAPAPPTPTASVTATASSTQTGTPTWSPSATPPSTATFTRTPSPTPASTFTRTPSRTPTATPSSTATFTRTRSLTPTSTFTRTPSRTPTVTPSSTATSTRTVTRTPTGTMTGAPTATPLPEPCDFIGPRMCGGACPNPDAVCQPLPDDSGCACVNPPVLGGSCGNGMASCSYHARCDASAPGALVCVNDGISSGNTCSSDANCFPGLPLCVGTPACGLNFCYQPCP